MRRFQNRIHIEQQVHNDHASPYRRSTGTWASRVGHHSVRRKLLHPLPLFEGGHFQGELHPWIVSLQIPLCVDGSLASRRKQRKESGLDVLAPQPLSSLHLVSRCSSW